MKRTKKRMRILTILSCLFSVFTISAFTVSAHAVELPEMEKKTGIETVSSEAMSAEAVIRVAAEEGTKVTVENMNGSPKPDRSSFICKGNQDNDCFTVLIAEPGDYSYDLTVGGNEYMVKVTGVFEDAEGTEVLSAKTAILLPDGTKTDMPTWSDPDAIPLGISDTPAGKILTVFGSIGLLTGLGLLLILRKKEEKRTI